MGRPPKVTCADKGDAIPVQITEEPATELDRYASISIAFEVRAVLDVEPRPDGDGFLLNERVLETSYVKDYDTVAGDAPTDWARRFDLSKWGLLFARVDGQHVGSAAIAFDTPGLTMLNGRRDVAILWDIRVAADARGSGVGSALFRAVEAWARARGCRQLVVETQNVNVPACRFYARQGCTLGSMDRLAYPDLPDEVQLIWIKDLS